MARTHASGICRPRMAVGEYPDRVCRGQAKQAWTSHGRPCAEQTWTSQSRVLSVFRHRTSWTSPVEHTLRPGSHPPQQQSRSIRTDDNFLRRRHSGHQVRQRPRPSSTATPGPSTSSPQRRAAGNRLCRRSSPRSAMTVTGTQDTHRRRRRLPSSYSSGSSSRRHRGQSCTDAAAVSSLTTRTLSWTRSSRSKARSRSAACTRSCSSPRSHAPSGLPSTADGGTTRAEPLGLNHRRSQAATSGGRQALVEADARSPWTSTGLSGCSFVSIGEAPERARQPRARCRASGTG